MASPTTTDQAARWAWIRSQTPAMERTTYLNCGFSGPLSNDVATAMQRRLDLEVQDGPISRHVQEDKADIMNRLREAGAERGTVDRDRRRRGGLAAAGEDEHEGDRGEEGSDAHRGSRSRV